MAAPEVTELNTPLYQRVGENLYQLHVQTTAEQVKMKNAEQGDSSVQQEIETLRGKLDNILSASDAMVFKGVVNQDSDIAAADYQAGWTYKVGTAGTYKGQKCEVGDLIVCVKDHADSAADSDWTVVQTNIDGAVTGPESAADGNLPAFDGATGRIIRDSALRTADVSDAVTKKHEHANRTDVLDKLSTQDGELLFDGKRINDGLVEVASAANIDAIPENLRDGGLLIIAPALGA